jgi:acetoin utilization protein AcuB
MVNLEIFRAQRKKVGATIVGRPGLQSCGRAGCSTLPIIFSVEGSAPSEPLFRPSFTLCKKCALIIHRFINMIVRMYMTRDVETVSPKTHLGEAAQKMSDRGIRRLIVTEGDRVVGILCKHDLIKAFPNHINPFSALGLDDPVARRRVEVAMNSPVTSIEASEPLEHASALMMKHHIGGLPVTSNGKLVGIITESDIFKSLTKLLAGHGNSIRITFDITDSENILSFLEDLAREYNVQILSFITFHEEDRRLAVVRVRGGDEERFEKRLWSSGFTVLNIVRMS